MSTVDEVKQRLDIVEVVSGYVTLTPAGRNLKALCPFHTERTPSFIVTPERGTWRCFGACATGGDIITFIMQAESLDFPEALRHLARQAGVSVADRRQTQTQPQDPLVQVNQAAARFYHQQLLSPNGAAARSYLEGRGVSPEAIESFALGWAAPGGDVLKGGLRTQGFSEELMQQAGLLHRSAQGHVRDLFRGRLLFPIRDAQGNTVGFGGRSLDDTPPKYLNTPQTPLFNKSTLLYALDAAADPIRLGGEAVVVEGYMDALMAHQHGFTNVVASMGTALTERQVAQLVGLAKSVVLALDPDTAGQEATIRSLESSWRVFQPPPRQGRGAAFSPRPKTTLRLALLPSGMDPDLLIRQEPQAWAQAVEEAQSLVDFLFQVLPERYDLTTPGGRLQLAERLGGVLLTLEESGQQDHYLGRLEELLGVNRRTLDEVLGLSRRALLGPAGARRGGPVQGYVAPFARARGDTLEEHLLALLLQDPDLKAACEPAEDLARSFRQGENREIFTHWIASDTIDRLRDDIDASLHEHLDAILLRPLPPTDLQERQEALAHCLRRLEERDLRELKAQESVLLASAQEETEEAELMELALERNRRLHRLFTSAPQQGQRGLGSRGGR